MATSPARHALELSKTAVTDILHGVQFSVMAGNTALKDYEDRDEEEPDDRTITRYIEAKNNQESRIECEVKHGLIRKKKKAPGSSLGIKVYVDGNSVDQFIVMRSDVKESAYLTESLGLDQPGGMVQKYRFSTLETGTRASHFACSSHATSRPSPGLRLCIVRGCSASRTTF